MRRLLALLLVAGAITGCRPGAPVRSSAPADPDSNEVAFTWGGLGEAAVVVPVHLNGRGPFSFVLDTGATFTCVDDALADSLALPDAALGTAIGGGIGGAGRVRLVQLDSLRVGPARAERLPACVVDLGHVEAAGLTADGLLGLNVLRQFHVALDFERRVVSLRAP